MAQQRYRAAIPYVLCAFLAVLSQLAPVTGPEDSMAPYQLCQADQSITFKLPRISFTKISRPPSVVAKGAQTS